MFLKIKNKFKKELFLKNNGEKRKFLLAGIINVILTNIILQALLFLEFIPVSTSTFISQLFNMMFGYFVYSKFIFKVKSYRRTNFIIKFATLMLIMWLFNFSAIEIGFNIGISKNLIAFLLIPILAVMSFILQKYWVFK